MKCKCCDNSIWAEPVTNNKPAPGMPIIEFNETTKTFTVYSAKTVEWGQLKRGNSFNGILPCVGASESSQPDSDQIFTFDDSDEKLAFAKMAELWAEWAAANFNNVTHA